MGVYICGVNHSIQSHHFMANRWGNSGNSVRVYFFWSPPKIKSATVSPSIYHEMMGPDALSSLNVEF